MDRFIALRVFVAVADQGGFAAGARQLGMSPPAVTRAVAALEAQLGVSLLRRSTRVVQLTEAGRGFLADARRILADLAAAEAAATGAHVEVNGALTVTAPVMFGQKYVVPVVLDVLAAYPRLSVRLLLRDGILDLLEHEVDVAVRIARLQPGSSDVAVRVGEVRRVTCAAPGYLTRRGAPETPEQLTAHECIVVVGSQTRSEWRYVDRRKGGSRELVVRPHGRLSVDSIPACLDAALAGHGIIRPLSYQVAEPLAAGRLSLLLEPFAPPPTPVQLLYRDGRRAPARVRTFVTAAAERLKSALRTLRV